MFAIQAHCADAAVEEIGSASEKSKRRLNGDERYDLSLLNNRQNAFNGREELVLDRGEVARRSVPVHDKAERYWRLRLLPVTICPAKLLALSSGHGNSPPLA